MGCFLLAIWIFNCCFFISTIATATLQLSDIWPICVTAQLHVVIQTSHLRPVIPVGQRWDTQSTCGRHGAMPLLIPQWAGCLLLLWLSCLFSPGVALSLFHLQPVKHQQVSWASSTTAQACLSFFPLVFYQTSLHTVSDSCNLSESNHLKFTKDS